MAALVSVIIPTYNCAPYLAEAIDSALAQDYQPLEILVGDDGSTDQTQAVLDLYADRVKVLPLPHRGVSATRNALLRVAQGQFIAPLDADDVWMPGKIRLQMEALQARPQASFCHTAATMFGSGTGDGPITHDRRQRIGGDCFEPQFFQTGVMCTTVLLRRERIPEHGFYEDLPVGEDYALFLEMLAGYEAVYLPQPLVQVRRRPGQATADRGQRLQIYNGLARLRALDYLSPRLDPALKRRLELWALDELQTCAYSRYWRRDFEMARRGFAMLARFGRSVPLRHRLWAWVRDVGSSKGEVRSSKCEVRSAK